MTPNRNPLPEPWEMSVSVKPEELAATDLPERTEPLTEEEIEAMRDADWAHTDPEVQQRYPDKIVAVYRRKVVAVGEDWKTVRDEAMRVTGAPLGHIAVIAVLGPSILDY